MRKFRIAFLIFIITFALYSANLPFDYFRNLNTHSPRRLLTSKDTASNAFIPYLILKYKTLDFTPIYDDLQRYIPGDHYYVFEINDGYYSKYPIMSGLLSVPIYLIPLKIGKVPNLDTMLNVYKVLVLARLSATFYTSLSVVLFYLILKELKSDKTSNKFLYLFTFGYAFGTNAFAIASRSLWAHTSSLFLLSLATYLLVLGRKNNKFIPPISLILGLAVIARPTNILPALFLSLYILFNHKDKLLEYILWGIPSVLFYFGLNKLQYGAFYLEGYQLSDDLTFNTPLYISIPGMLFSPSKGILITEPFMFFGLIPMLGALFKKNRNKTESLLAYISLAFISGFLLAAKWRDWDGADRFGPGFLTEYLTFLGIFAFRFFEEYKNKRYVRVLLTITIIYSFLIQTNAVIFHKSRCKPEHDWDLHCISPPSEWPKY